MMAFKRVYRLLLLAGIAAGSGWLAVERGGASAAFLFAIAGGVGLLSAGSLLLLLMSVRAERRLASAVIAPGGSLQVELRIRHTSLVPLLWVAVTERWIRLGDGEELRVTRLACPGLRREFRIRYRVSGLRRGEYRHVETELVTGDIWGLTQKRRRLQTGGAFAVLPEIRPLVAVTAPGLTGVDEDGRIPPTAGSGMPGVLIRSYVPGDPLRTIHWKSSARTGELRTRTPEPAEERRYLVLLDAGAPAYAASNGSRLFEAAVEWTCGLLQAASDSGHPAGLACTGREPVWRPPLERPDPGSLYRLLAGLEPSAEGGLQVLTDRTVRLRSCICVLVSPALDNRVLGTLEQWAAAGLSVQLVHVRDGAPSFAEREKLRRAERLTGQPVLAARPSASERRLMLHAEPEGA